MFGKILVAVDRSDMGTHVFEEALALVKAHDAEMMLLHVLFLEDENYSFASGHPSANFDPGALTTVLEGFQQRWEARENEGLSLLKSFAEQAEAENVKAEYSQNLGSPGPTICSMAKSWDADLIVMGRRGLSGLRELLMGSVSNYVLHHATCSVLAVQPKTK